MTRQPSTHDSPACAVCRNIWDAVAALSERHGRPPSYTEINASLESSYRGFGSLTNHVASLITGGYLENRWQHRGLHVLRPLPTQDQRGGAPDAH